MTYEVWQDKDTGLFYFVVRDGGFEFESEPVYETSEEAEQECQSFFGDHAESLKFGGLFVWDNKAKEWRFVLG